jgi:hypothetical protein
VSSPNRYRDRYRLEGLFSGTGVIHPVRPFT